MDIHIDLERLYSILLAVLPIALWIAWWLWAVNWNRMGPVLREGAWAPVLLLIVITAFVWSRIVATDCACLQGVIIPNFWWQLGSLLSLVLIALFCGWLQGLYGWYPPEVAVEPPAHGHDDELSQHHDGDADHGEDPGTGPAPEGHHH